jgi:predicted transcriptional regulator
MIAAQILEIAASGPVSKSKIMYKAYLSPQQLKEYPITLIEKGLIKHIQANVQHVQFTYPAQIIVKNIVFAVTEFCVRIHEILITTIESCSKCNRRMNLQRMDYPLICWACAVATTASK